MLALRMHQLGSQPRNMVATAMTAVIRTRRMAHPLDYLSRLQVLYLHPCVSAQTSKRHELRVRPCM
jgi:hypothetical protein